MPRGGPRGRLGFGIWHLNKSLLYLEKLKCPAADHVGVVMLCRSYQGSERRRIGLAANPTRHLCLGFRIWALGSRVPGWLMVWSRGPRADVWLSGIQFRRFLGAISSMSRDLGSRVDLCKAGYSLLANHDGIVGHVVEYVAYRSDCPPVAGIQVQGQGLGGSPSKTAAIARLSTAPRSPLLAKPMA